MQSCLSLTAVNVTKGSDPIVTSELVGGWCTARRIGYPPLVGSQALEQRFGLGAACDDREIPPDQGCFVEAGAEAELAKAIGERAIIDCAQLLGRSRRIAFEQACKFVGERGVEVCGLRPVDADAE